MQAAGGLAAGGILGRAIAGLPEVVALAAAVLLSIWLTGFVNAFNFMDGINGISGAHALVGGAAYACIGLLAPGRLPGGGGAAVAAGGAGLPALERGRARVFLGDVGSYALGAALALLAACAVRARHSARGRAGPAGPVPGRHRLDDPAPVRAGEPLAPGPPHARLPAAVRRGLVAPAGHAGHRGRRRSRSACSGRSASPAHPGLRAAADLTAIALLAAYLAAPTVLGPRARADGQARP